MGARSSGGASSWGRKTNKFRKKLAELQSQYDAARKSYNSIKKTLPKGGPISTSYAVNKIMTGKGMKTPSQIKVEIENFARNFNWGGSSF